MKKIKLSNDIELNLRSLTLNDLAEEHELIDFVLNILTMIEEEKDGVEIVNALITDLPDVCYSVISRSITPEDGENPTLPNQIKHFFNLQDQIDLLMEVLLISIPDLKKLKIQREKGVRLSEQMKKLITRFK